MESVWFEDKNLLLKAKDIFGHDLIVNAFVYINFYQWDLEHQETKISKHMQSEYDGKCEQIDYDGNDIKLIFSNGKMVGFSNSEWASIYAID
jgi:hypothetical protein